MTLSFSRLSVRAGYGGGISFAMWFIPHVDTEEMLEQIHMKEDLKNHIYIPWTLGNMDTRT